MFVVLDTNIIVSALFWGGVPRKVLELTHSKHKICFSEETLKELEGPVESYSRNLSDLIRSLRDISENLILAGAIPRESGLKKFL